MIGARQGIVIGFGYNAHGYGLTYRAGQGGMTGSVGETIAVDVVDEANDNAMPGADDGAGRLKRRVGTKALDDVPDPQCRIFRRESPCLSRMCLVEANSSGRWCPRQDNGLLKDPYHKDQF